MSTGGGGGGGGGDQNLNVVATIAFLILSILASPISGDPIHFDLLRSSDHGGGDLSQTPMILPLVLSYPNSSRNWRAEDGTEKRYSSRRHLQKAGANDADAARMRLYDDLLANGYYTTRLYIGTPPQEFALIVDSGSTVTYVPCSTCQQCGNHQDPRFQPNMSSTYKPVKCSDGCNCDTEKDQCIYERQYAEMSSSSGVLGEDIMSFGNESALEPQKAIFGCENIETGDLFSQHADGIMGLGRGHLSIMDQLVGNGVISDSFSLCYGGMDVGGGAMVLGNISPPPGMVFSHSDPVRSIYYNIELKEIHISGKSLQLSPSIFDGKHGTVLDSGTTYAYLPEQAFVAFRDSVMEHVQHLKKIRGPDPTYKDICFSGAGSEVSELSKSFPEVDIVFTNGQKLSLSPENYLFRHSKVPGAYCLGIFQNGRDPTTLLGGIFVRNTLVTYDRGNDRIGFWKTNCSELWDRLHVNTISSQSPLSPFIAPSDGPSSSEQDDMISPDRFRVGLITFDLSLSTNYSVLVHQIPELTKLIAQDLDLTTSQVHVVSFQSERNGSFMRWAIFPSTTEEFMSNATAMSIVSRLSEHRVHLPNHFGSYELLEWKVEPLSKRSWLQNHIMHGVLLVTAVILSISLFAYFIHRRRQGTGVAAYRPVNAPGPEHELQPL
ncbi:hypothetical protein ZOSMA_38G00380 [Zostera marina]|uniref:Peptidase A1 domain-containing protein n=1 Tax=Zostera marina TaxID=29655 RepID=A0A0K9P6V5_ZOSMR|nr:hypothetical protein ZOSMA_38G00380 [Zostera marina]